MMVSTLLLAAIGTASLPSAAMMPRAHRGPTSPSMFSKRARASKPATQRAIAPERATEIQNALIKSGYMTGAASGTWDASTVSAMEKFQADNGWQTKLVPDSRAIIKLGLGPNNEASTAGEIAGTDAAKERVNIENQQ